MDKPAAFATLWAIDMLARAPTTVTLAFLFSACNGAGDGTAAEPGELQDDDGPVTTSSNGSESDDEGEAATTSTGSASDSAGASDSASEGESEGEDTANATSTSSSDDGVASSSDDDAPTESSTSDDATESSTGSPGADGLPMEESFTGNGGPWPAPWTAIGGAVLTAELLDDRGRLSGAMGYVARMSLPGYDVVDLDATVVVAFDDATRQGFGFYARQNGGVLHETEPPGQGYCVYVEGEGVANLGIWRELGGVEQLLAGADNPIAGGIQPGVDYALRLQIVQSGATTQLRTKMWRADQAEPPTWAVELEDDTAELQGTAGSFAVDVYNYDGTGSVYVDDIVVVAP